MEISRRFKEGWYQSPVCSVSWSSTAGANNQSLSVLGGPLLTKNKGPPFGKEPFQQQQKRGIWCQTCGCVIVASMFAQSDHVWMSYGGDRVYLSSFDRDVYLSSTANPIYPTHPSPLRNIHHDIFLGKEPQIMIENAEERNTRIKDN